MATLSEFNSSKFRFWLFLSMILLVIVHGYNLNERYLEPWTLVDEPLTFTTFFEYLTANGLFRFFVPMLFAISGFLYTLSDHKPYGVRTRKRLRTLGIPYLLWSAVGLALVFGMEHFAYTRNIIASTHMMQIQENRIFLADYHWYEVLVRWILVPVPYQLWFIRVLLIYNIAYPAIRWCMTHRVARWVYFSLAGLLWWATVNVGLLEGEGLVFYGLGIWIAKTDFNIDTPTRWLSPKLWGPIFIGLSLVKTLLAFRGMAWLGGAVFPTLTIMHKLVELSGFVFCWYGFNMLVRWSIKREWFAHLSSYSFMIYGLHAPLVAFAIESALQVIGAPDIRRMVAYILLPVVIIAFCVGVGALLKALSPKLYGLFTGGRGLG